MEKTKARGHIARRAARIANARRRFARWEEEMKAWGYEITPPPVLTPPAE